MTQLPWRPVLADLGGLADRPELPPDVSGVQGSARPGGKTRSRSLHVMSAVARSSACRSLWAQSAVTAISGQGVWYLSTLIGTISHGAEHQGSGDRTPGGRGCRIDGNDEDRSRPVRLAPGSPGAV